MKRIQNDYVVHCARNYDMCSQLHASDPVVFYVGKSCQMYLDFNDNDSFKRILRNILGLSSRK